MKARLMSVRNTTWAFYEAMDNGSKESMADYFETLMHHYKQRGILQKETKQRFSYWEDSRGAYVLSQKYRNELKEFLFNGTSKTLCNWETIKTIIKKEKANLGDKKDEQ